MMWKMFYAQPGWCCELHRSKCNTCKVIIYTPCQNAVTFAQNALNKCTSVCVCLCFFCIPLDSMVSAHASPFLFTRRKGNPLDNFFFIDNFNNLIIKMEKEWRWFLGKAKAALTCTHKHTVRDKTSEKQAINFPHQIRFSYNVCNYKFLFNYFKENRDGSKTRAIPSNTLSNLHFSL